MTHLDRLAASFLILFLTVWCLREADYSSRKSTLDPPIVVSVTGAVARPGVIQLPAAARAVHAITMCGGLTSSADSEAIQLARSLKDGEHLSVPTLVRESPPPRLNSSPLLGEGSSRSSPETSIDSRPVSDRRTREADSPHSGATPFQPEAFSQREAPASRSSRRRTIKTFPSTPIDINTASVEDLIALPGIGPKTAQRIVESRQTEHSGTFTSLEDLATIRGIKGKTLSRLRPYLKIEGS